MQLRLGIPREARSLPPPPLLTFPSVWMAGTFWLSALLDNGLNRRPILRAGIHRQILMTTLGFCLGYYVKRYSNYYCAERDRELYSYIKQHPEDFVEKGAFFSRGNWTFWFFFEHASLLIQELKKLLG